MTSTDKTGKNIRPMRIPGLALSLGLLLGFLADRLWVAGGPTGIGFVVWIGILAVAACCVAQRARAVRINEVIAWSAVSFAASLVLLIRATPMVVLSMGLIMIVAAAMVVMQKNNRSFRDTTIADHLIAAARVPKLCLLTTFSTLGKVDMGSTLSSSRFRTISRGTFLATPPLAIFMSLFMSADATFNRYAVDTLNILSPSALNHLIVIFLFSWIATGLLAGVGERHFLIASEREPLLKLGTEDTAVFLGLLAALFLGFVYLQLGYLFGGRETIEATSGLTRAEYARRGFFELLLVAGLTLALLITVAATNCNKRVFRPLAGILIACVFVILASAAQRMWLYVIEFGLSIDRITAIAVMGWLAFGLILFVITLMQGRTKDFAAGLTASAVLAAFLLALSNPAAIVTSVNIDHGLTNEKSVDVLYLLSLGADAVPTIVSNMDKLSSYSRCIAATSFLPRLRSDANRESYGDWRWWNASHAAALGALANERQVLERIVATCPPGQQP